MEKKRTYKTRTLSDVYWKGLLITWLTIFTLLIICLLLISPSDLLSICLLIISIFALIAFLGWISTLPRYQIDTKMVRCTFLGYTYRKIPFSDYPIILVTNGVFHVRNSGLIAGEMPIIQKIKTKHFGYQVSAPYFIAVSRKYPLDKLRPNLNAAEIYQINWYHAEPIGLYNPNAMDDLLSSPSLEIYIQSDVLQHYPEMIEKKMETENREFNRGTVL